MAKRVKGRIIAQLERDDGTVYYFNNDAERCGHVRVRLYGAKRTPGQEWPDPQVIADGEAEDACKDVVITSQMDIRTHEERNHTYAWDVEVRDSLGLDLARMERHVKLLRMIKRKMAKWDEQWSRPATFGEYVRRVLRALPYVVTVKCRIEGSTYDQHSMNSLDRVVWWVDGAVGEWHHKYGRKDEAAA